MYQKIAIASGLFVLLIGFQNCADTHFGSVNGDEIAAKGSFTQLDINAPDVPADDASGSVSQPSTTPNPPADDKKNHDDQAVADGNSHDDASSDDDSHDGVSSDDSSSDDADLVACILVREGKSMKLGFISESLDGVMGVAQSVCISEKACTEIVPKLFDVVGPEHRGYCEHNPNVKRLTDAEVQALVDKALVK